MRRAACARDDHLQPARRRTLGVIVEPVRRAVGGDDLGLMGYAQLLQDFGSGAQGGPVRLASHDDSDEWGHASCGVQKEAAEYRHGKPGEKAHEKPSNPGVNTLLTVITAFLTNRGSASGGAGKQ